MGFWDWLDYLKAGTQASNRQTSNALSGASRFLGGNAFGGGRDNVQRSLTRPTRPARTPITPPNVGPSIADIIAELERLQDPDRYMVDQGLLERQARAAASVQYDPIIAQLRNQMGLASSRAERNKTQLGQMFGGLSQSLLGDIAPIQQQFAQTKQTTANQYANLQNQLQQQYSSSQAEQEAMMRRLNIEAAAPQALEGQQKDKQFFMANAATEGQTAQTALTQEETGAVNYTRQGSEIARMEGTSRQADLMAQLSELLTSLEGEIGANEAAKSATYQGALAELMGKQEERAIDRSQRDFENKIKVIQLMRALSGEEDEGPVKSPSQIGSRALNLGMDPDSSQNIQNVFMSALGSDPAILSGLDSKYGVSLPAESLATRVVEAGRQQGLSNDQLNVLHTIALEYFGRR